ncbi:MAG: hypothetical protein JSS82_16005 [Bacteroidetes bacterium]|nr:hypothetical protein [Bacteroidota bacterium]
MRSALFFLLLLIPALALARVTRGVEAVEWNSSRKLDWNDFQAKAPASAYEAALSQCGIGYATTTAPTNQALNVKVSAKFYLGESWSRGSERSSRLLQHEQTHFDLCEVYARKLRQNIASNHYTGADIKKMDKAYGELTAELNKVELQYDEETIHGLNTAKQDEWNARIAKQLEALNSFTN